MMTDGPEYLTWKDDNGVTHVEIHELASEYVIWKIKNGIKTKIYDYHEKPF